MEQLFVVPQQSGYSVQEAGNAWLSTELDGGLPRTRRDLFDPEPIVSVQWMLGITYYTYLTEFYRANAARDFEPFLTNLYLDTSQLVLHQVRFVPRSFALTKQVGDQYYVSAKLAVKLTRTDDSWPPYVPTVEEEVQWILLFDEYAVFEDNGGPVQWDID